MVPAAPRAPVLQRSRGGKESKAELQRTGRKRKAYLREIRMYRVVIKQLQLSSLSPRRCNISLLFSFSLMTSFSLTSFFSPFFQSLPLSLPLPPLFSLFYLLPLIPSFWTLSRCACGNFPGVIFAAFLARSLTSLTSVYLRRHFSQPRSSSFSLSSPCLLFFSSLSERSFHIPIRFHVPSRFYEPPRQTSPGFHPYACMCVRPRYAFPSISVFIV